MKKFLLLLLVLFNGEFILSAQNATQVTIQNNTEAALYHIYLSPADSDYWGPDLLSYDDVLIPGESAGFEINNDAGFGHYDLVAVDENDIAYTLELSCEAGQTTLCQITPQYKTGEFTSNVGEIHLINKTGQTIKALYISPDDSEFWGVNLINSDQSLISEGECDHNLPVSDDDEPVSYNIMAVTEEGLVYLVDIEVEKNGETLLVVLDESHRDVPEND